MFISHCKTVAGLFALVVGVSLLFTPAGSAQDRPDFDVSHVSDQGGMVYAIRPKAIFESESLGAFREAMNRDFERQFGLGLDRVNQIVGAAGDPQDALTMRAHVNTEAQFDPKRYFQSFRLEGEPEQAEHNGVTYLRAKVRNAILIRADRMVEEIEPEEGEERILAVWQPDESSAVVAAEDEIKRLIDKQKPTHKLFKSKAWQKVAGHAAAFAVDADMIERMAADMSRGKAFPDEVQVVLKHATSAAAGIEIESRKISLSGTMVCKTPAGSRESKEAIETLAKMGVTMLRMQISAHKGQKIEASMMKVSVDLLENLKITRNGNQLNLVSSAEIGELASADGIAEAKIAAARTQSMNNGKQLALAFHNFTDAMGKFPAANGIGPKGHPYSWRVAALPYLGEQALHDQYNFEEPWDSEANLKVLAQMPATFRHPLADEGSTDTSYLALVGPDTLFWKEGASFRDVTDGTSNTIMYIEAKKAVPWTKPEDLPYDPFDKDPLAPKLGGFFDEGFNAVFADGSVQFIEKGINDETLHRYIQMNDGEPVE